MRSNQLSYASVSEQNSLYHDFRICQQVFENNFEITMAYSKNTDEGFDLHFDPTGIKIKVWPPSRPAASNSPQDCCIGWVRIPRPKAKKKSPSFRMSFSFLAEDEGFEPPQTESESGVLPLHKSSKHNTCIIHNPPEKSSTFLKNFEIFLLCLFGGHFWL